MTDPLLTDGSQLRAILDLLGAPAEPTDATRARVAELERWVGPLPPEARAYLLTPVDLWTYDHPHASTDFAQGLPDVAAFFDGLTLSYQGRMRAALHLHGLYPIGAHIHYNEYMLAGLVLEPYTSELGGVMYYDEREIGGWGHSVSAFLVDAVSKFWKEVDGELDELEEGDKPDLNGLRDCFHLEGYDYQTPPPETAEPAPDVAEAWETHWRTRLEQSSRWWVTSFVSNRLDRGDLRQLPTEAEWEAQKERVPRIYHDAVYWLVAHTLLDNQAELNECLELTRDHPSEFVRTIAEHLHQNPTFGDRFAEPRAALFTLAREGADLILGK